MKLKDLLKAERLLRELSEEIQRLEHHAHNELPDSATEPTDEIENIRSCRDSIVDARDTFQLVIDNHR